MARKVRIPAGQPVGLKLTQAEREFLLDTLILIDEDVEGRLRSVPPGETKVMLSLDEIDLLPGSVAAEAKHTKDKKLDHRLERTYDRICQREDLFEEA